MVDPHTFKLPTMEGPATYRIRVKGRLLAPWRNRVQGMQVEILTGPDGSEQTELRGLLEDQAALAGVLTTLYELRLPVLSVECCNGTPKTTETD